MLTFSEWFELREDFANEPIVSLFHADPTLNDRQIMMALRSQGINIPFSRVVGVLSNLRKGLDTRLDKLIGNVLANDPNLPSKSAARIVDGILKKKGLSDIEPFQIVAAINRYKAIHKQTTQGEVNPYLGGYLSPEDRNRFNKIDKTGSLGNSSIVKPYLGSGGPPVKGHTGLPSPDFGHSTGGGKKITR